MRQAGDFFTSGLLLWTLGCILTAIVASLALLALNATVSYLASATFASFLFDGDR